MGFAPSGVGKLSALEIDTSKDWAGYKIKNIGAGVDDTDALKKMQAILESLLTTKGDVIYRGDSVAERLAADIAGEFLQTRGITLPPQWTDVGGYAPITRLFFLSIPTPTIELTATEDHSGGGQTQSETLTIPVPTISQTTSSTSSNACGGAVAHNEDVGDSDETAEANSPAANDMTLLQADGALQDWYALGYASKFDTICVNVGTAGADITLDTFQYSKGGGTWGTLTTLHTGLNNWETSGKVWYTFARPDDWAVDTYAAIADMYWIKLKASAVGAGYSQPLGTQAWILVY